jgi:hypothetical protein
LEVLSRGCRFLVLPSSSLFPEVDRRWKKSSLKMEASCEQPEAGSEDIFSAKTLGETLRELAAPVKHSESFSGATITLRKS